MCKGGCAARHRLQRRELAREALEFWRRKALHAVLVPAVRLLGLLKVQHADVCVAHLADDLRRPNSADRMRCKCLRRLSWCRGYELDVPGGQPAM